MFGLFKPIQIFTDVFFYDKKKHTCTNRVIELLERFNIAALNGDAPYVFLTNPDRTTFNAVFITMLFFFLLIASIAVLVGSDFFHTMKDIGYSYCRLIMEISNSLKDDAQREKSETGILKTILITEHTSLMCSFLFYY